MTQPLNEPRVAYLAGPEVFLPNAAEVGRKKQQICRKYGLDGIFPNNPTYDPSGRTLTEQAHDVFELCIQQMDRSDLIVANMTPFRGVSMDVGTAIEVGYMFGLGRPVFGYTNTRATYAARVERARLDVGPTAVEPFKLFDNLMCEGPIWKTQGTIVKPTAGFDLPLDDLGGFEICVEMAAASWRQPHRPQA